MSSGGFTEDDQARIAEEVLGRVGAKRTGLGFSGGGGGAQPAKGNASSSSSGWFEQHTQSAAREEYVGNETRDTTAGPFAWDGGQRGKAKGDARKKDDRGVTRIAPSREADGPAEREFPMVRERDIERSRGRRDEKSRKRSRSRSRGRRSRSRSRSRERRRERQRERERQRGRAKEWERDRDRERERERERERDRERNRRSRRSKSPPSTRFRDGARKPQRGNETGRKATGAITTAEQAKAAVKRRLRQVVASDATLKSGAKATTGGGTSWERPEMSTASEFFQSDEVASKGGVASVASEYEARLAEILAVENEEVMCLGDKAQPVAGAGSTSSSALEQKHHDAIFAPTGAVSQPITSVPAATPAAGIRSVGAIGAAGRARLALTGKLGKESTAKPKSTPSSAGQSIKRAEEHSQPRRDDSDQPLFKTLRTGESVEACYTADDKWYGAIVLQVIHGGFEIARYKVRYSAYGNEETLPWTKIRRTSEPSHADSCSVNQEAVEPETVQSGEEVAAPADEAPPPFAGMRPRALCVEKETPPKPQASEKDTSAQAGAADVVNAALRSATPGRKLSWKDKLAARKSGVSGQASAGVHVLPKKQISLIPDFAAQRKDQELDTAMDKSEWRTRVAFGMGNSKRRSS